MHKMCMTARNQQLINNTEALMAKFCQYECLLLFTVVIVIVIDLEESSVKMNRWMALGYLLPSVLVYILNRHGRTLLKHLEDF